MRAFSEWSEEDIKKYYARINKTPPKINFNIENEKLIEKKKKSKYKANRVEIDGVKFDSQKEADYYCELKLRLQAGEINGFCRQAEFILDGGIRYIADFIVFYKDHAEVIDVKGFKTDVYKLKKKLFESRFNLKIIEK
jgi:hypothetical protein